MNLLELYVVLFEFVINRSSFGEAQNFSYRYYGTDLQRCKKLIVLNIQCNF